MNRCLIVEDDREIALELRDEMEGLGFECDCCGTVKEASSHLNSTLYRLVLLDYSLPDGNTMPLVDLANMRNPDGKIVTVSGTGIFPNGEQSILAPNIDWVVRKPFRMDELRAIVQHVVRL